MSGKDLIDSVRVSDRLCQVLGGDAAGELPLRTVHGREQPEDLQVQGQRPDHGGMAALRRARKPRLLHVPVAASRPSGCISTSFRARRTNICSSWTPTTGRGDNAGQSARQPGLARPRRRAAGQGLAGLVQPAAEPGLGRQRLGQGASCGGSCRAICRARRPRASRCSTGSSATRSTTTRTSCCRRSASARPTIGSARRSQDLLARLKALPADCQDAEAIQNEVYDAGKAAGLRAAARLVRGALRGAAGPEPGAAVRLLRRHLRPRNAPSP